jgi:lipopolysaccharide transport protein LptA
MMTHPVPSEPTSVRGRPTLPGAVAGIRRLAVALLIAQGLVLVAQETRNSGAPRTGALGPKAVAPATVVPPPPAADLEKLLKASAGKRPGSTPAPQPLKTAAETPAPAGGEIDISADSMDMDFGARVSTFTGNVVVVEPRMKLSAEKMVISFGRDDKPERIEATGSVTIEQPDADRVARAGRAEYDVLKGMIVLTDKPTLNMGNDNLTGATRIVYYRDSSKVTCDSSTGDVRPRIIITPKSPNSITDVLKSTGKDGN